MKRLISQYHPRFLRSLVFMLQASEYDVAEYMAWFWRAGDFTHVERRGRLTHTAKAKLLFAVAVAVSLASAVVFGSLIGLSVAFGIMPWGLLALAWLLLAPFITAFSLAAVLLVGHVLVQRPRERAIIGRAAATIKGHSGYRIGIAGSYGKTTFKEILLAVLGEAKHVAATPGNMNTPLGISRFVARLTGKEDVLIFELGEYYPGDIKALCELTRPQLGVITGINEAHLSKFKTLERTTATIFEIEDYLTGQPVYKNGDNQLVAKRAGAKDPLAYTGKGVNGWKVSGITIGLDATAFTAIKGKKVVQATSGLLGAQQVGPLVAAIDIADRLGLTPTQIMAGIAKTTPYEHRMQPRLQAGAWVIDDTYNGNSDGVTAGLAWLRAVPATRRIYVTPGLVEQGDRTAQVHEAMGRAIAGVADTVVLMQNSTTEFIQKGLTEAKFSGTLKIVTDPVHFYTNLDQFVAKGDVVLMQNDWTDNYA